jgi:hypothetical protein
MLGGGSWVAARQGQGYTQRSSTSDGGAAALCRPTLICFLDVLPPGSCSWLITACHPSGMRQ